MSSPFPLDTLSLCSGIGGLELGLERAGICRVRYQVECDSYCRGILAKHWPEAEQHEDVTQLATDRLVRVGLVCGGFPCQPASVAGKRLGSSDPRWLWPHFARIVKEVAPPLCIFENVLGLRTAGLRDVLADLADLGFDAEWVTVEAAWLGASHRRPRIFIVGTHADRIVVRDEPGWLERSLRAKAAAFTRDDVERLTGSHADSLWRLESSRRFAELRGWSEHCGWTLGSAPFVDDGAATGLARGTIGKARKALGNAVVVRCAEMVGRAVAESCVLSSQINCHPATAGVVGIGR